MTRGWGVAVCAAVLLSPAIASAADKGSVTFVVRDERGNDLDAKVTIDQDATPIPLGRQQTLEPGIHDVYWSLANGTRGSQKLTVIEGQYGRIFQIVATAPPPPPPVVAPPPPASASAPAASLAASDASAAKSESSPWPYILLAGGGTLAVTGAFFQVVALNEDSDSQHYFWASTRNDLLPSSRESLDRAGRSHYDAAQTNQAIAVTCGILAVAAVSVAVTWLILGKK